MARGLNGSSDYIDFGSHTFDPNTTATVQCWLWITSLPSGYAGIVSMSDAGGNHYAHLYLESSGQLAIYLNNNWGSGSSDTLAGGPTLSTGQWYHLLYTVTASGTCQFYLNGATHGSFSAGASLGAVAKDFIAGQDAHTANRFTAGRFADVAIWNVVLTASEVAALSQGERPWNIRPSTLVLVSPLDGLQSPEPDLSGSALNGALTGTTSAAGPPLMLFTPRIPFISVAVASTTVFRRTLSPIGTRIGSRQQMAS